MMQKTVFIIGAGASKEVGLPVGSELKSSIIGLLDIGYDYSKQISGDYLIACALRVHSREFEADFNRYIEAALHIKKALPLAISIDNFMDAHRDNQEITLCGKLAVVRSILHEESKSKLFYEKRRIDETIDYGPIEDTWFISFFKLVTENCHVKELEERFKNITLIIFNYDRCIEHFMFHALKTYYGISNDDASKLVKLINIYHPYGSVGALSWYDHHGSMEYGKEPNAEQLLELVKKIKTFTEGTNPSESNILEIKGHLSKANRVVFMGFAFHKQNLELIAPERANGVNFNPKCYASTYLISESDRERVKSQINNLFGATINTKMSNLTCHNFLKEYWRSLAF
jgi:hypothetical protein